MFREIWKKALINQYQNVSLGKGKHRRDKQSNQQSKWIRNV